jgi:hypothetical protein
MQLITPVHSGSQMNRYMQYFFITAILFTLGIILRVSRGTIHNHVQSMLKVNEIVFHDLPHEL